MLRFFLVSLSWALVACVASHTVSEPEDVDASEPGTDTPHPVVHDGATRPDGFPDALPPGMDPPETPPKPTASITDHEIVRRDCASTPHLGWSVSVVQGPSSCGSSLPCGMECLHASDCDASPFGRCTGGGESRCVYGPERQTPGGSCAQDRECTLSAGGRCVPSPVPGHHQCEYPDVRFNAYESCEQDSDCTLAEDARCQRELKFSSCQYDGCRVDADCGEGAACICEFADHTCVPAQCRSDADCPGGHHCRYSQRATEQTGGLYCTTDADTCPEPSEFCEAEPWKVCAFDMAAGHWACLSTNEVPLPRRVR